MELLNDYWLFDYWVNIKLTRLIKQVIIFIFVTQWNNNVLSVINNINIFQFIYSALFLGDL